MPKIKDRAKPKTPSVEPGVYLSVCVGYIDLGEQYSEKFKNYATKGMYIWEIPSETIEVDGEVKPRQLSREYTLSSSKKGTLRGTIESWNGRTYSDDEFSEFELCDQVGKPCQLQVVLNETKEYANVSNLMPLPKGFPAPTTETKFIRWDMDKWDDAVFQELPEWIQEKIKKSTQYQKDHAPDTTVEVKDAPAPAAMNTPPAAETECPI